MTDLIHELRPPSINGVSFDETLNEYLIEWSHQNDIEFAITFDGYGDLPLTIKQAIYRIMQEALANISRHSAAKNVKIVISFNKKVVKFTIQDNGIGFETRQQFSGIGLN